MLTWFLDLIRELATHDDAAAMVKPADKRRSSQWPRVRDAFLKANPTCAFCGDKDNLTVHHCKPFHLWPELELLADNLLTVCEGPGGGCHLLLAHLKHWRSYNVTCREDAVAWLKKIQSRP